MEFLNNLIPSFTLVLVALLTYYLEVKLKRSEAAFTQGFVDADEAQEFTQHKRREEMLHIRDNQQAGHSSTHRHK